MTEGQAFVDYYSILQVNPRCDAKKLEIAYRRLAKIYHPDHVETADSTKFSEVVEAYKILRNADFRREYDILYKENTNYDDETSQIFDDTLNDEQNALSDADAHKKILLTLYKKRRENSLNPGVLAFYIKEDLHCSDEIFEFHAWYLRAKGYIERTEQNELAITVEGIDHVISASRTSMAAQMLIAQSDTTKARKK